MKKLFYIKNKSFYGSREVELENIEPITETPLEMKRKLKKKKITKRREQDEEN